MARVRDAGGTTTSADTAATQPASGKTVDASTMPYVFNPPPHPSILHKVPDLSATAGEYDASYKRVYNETSSEYAAGSEKSGAAFSTLRLGRIIMGESTLSYATQQSGKRSGFRFHYNPTTLTGLVSVGQDFIPNPGSRLGAMLQTGLEQIQIQLLLNRMPEVQGRAQPEDYPITVTGAEMKEMRERGTHYDVDFLYRVANGVHNTMHRQDTGDIGILMPNPCELHLGPFRTYGAIFTVSVTDQMYSADMVPMLSYVDITFARYLSFTPDESTLAMLKSTGVTMKDSDGSGSTDSSSDSSSSSSPSDSTPSGGVMTGGQVEKLAREAGWDALEARIATMIAWGESKWNPKIKHKDFPVYGLFQINMDPKYAESRRKQHGLKSNEDLFDPKINAGVAFKMYKARGNWNDWEVYTNTSSPVYYKKCPGWTSIV